MVAGLKRNRSKTASAGSSSSGFAPKQSGAACVVQLTNPTAFFSNMSSHDFRVLCVSKVGSGLQISQSVLEAEYIFELRNLYSPRFAESEICLPLFDYETQTEFATVWKIGHFLSLH